ncbi:histidinol-phosphate transaminase [Enterococcus sp. RIT-PI-f]|uniref:histidinol-phosphate transaminase n=1 Tax=Enterococcus sp. RIT-PI-f TaxID=1690244 RepID=UPI0006B9A32B|nr:histidinol-phosphate transaminase [Enterococcus sp. RIT-PI-f]KPG69925.1 histidinol-phosphate aminotransferase [Enterococcus sp. RIT-PI-f]
MTFLNPKYQHLVSYVPGEQPKQTTIIKLNTNENPYPPAPGVAAAVQAAAQQLAKYSDADCLQVRLPLAERFDVTIDEVFIGNGSDEVLSLAFQAFMAKGVAFPTITYGFYQVFADMYQVEARVVPLNVDLTLDLDLYRSLTQTIVIANPNAPTGLTLSASALEELVKEDLERLVIIDEAYVDFGGESMVAYTKQYANLLVIGTFSKSRQLAGARLGYAVGDPSLIADLNRLKFAVNPYNVNSLTLAAGAAALADERYFHTQIEKVIQVREWTKHKLTSMGFQVTDSAANFVFIAHPQVSAKVILEKLKADGIYVRWFDHPLIDHYLRVTIGTSAQMDRFVQSVQQILKEAVR